MIKILVVEDDLEMNQGIFYILEKEGFSTVSVCTIADARKQYRENTIQMVLLDVNLPDGEGYIFCKEIRENGKVPVLFLTARDLEDDALKGYEVGAEDYITKPFSMKILLKKIELILKRKEQKQQIFEDGHLRINFTTAKADIEGKECILTPTEFRLLQELVFHEGQLLTYEILLERLWDSGSQFVDKHALAVNVNRLRRKIEDEHHKYISNVYGMGYQWVG